MVEDRGLYVGSFIIYISVSQPFKGCGAPDNKIVEKALLSKSGTSFFSLEFCGFQFLWEHFKTAHGALVVPRAVVGYHCSRPIRKLRNLLI